MGRKFSTAPEDFRPLLAPHSLYEHGKKGNECENPAIYHGPCKQRYNDGRLQPYRGFFRREGRSGEAGKGDLAYYKIKKIVVNL